MLQCIHLDPRVYKCLEIMRRSGKKAALAADKVEEIMARLRNGGVIPDRVGTVTKHGELRIKGVMKYDLGSGYRLITYKQGHRFFLLYTGSHDDCHRWIENNRELTVAQIEERCVVLPVCAADDADAAGALEDIREEEDFDPLAEICERDLRRVFCGLVGEAH
jgi:hypothetical protein